MTQARKRRGFLHEMRTNYNLYLMILPATALFLIFHYLPMYGITIAFKRYDIVLGVEGSPWIGLMNFRNFFRDPYFLRILRNTVVLGGYSIIFGFWPPIMLALLLQELPMRRLVRVYQSISYLPHFIAMVIIVGIMMELLRPTGIINQMIEAVSGQTVSFFTVPKYFRSMYILSGIWQGVGYGSIIYMSTLSGIDPQLYEAAFIDGANRFQRVWHVTMPGLLPVMAILLVLNAGSIINVGFEKAFLMQNPAIYETADVISTYVYRRGIQNTDFSYATAVGLFNSVISFIIVFSANKISGLLQQNTLW